MNGVEAFAASRRDRMSRADEELRPLVLAALSQWGPGDGWFEELKTAASVLWLEVFEQEAPSADPERFLGLYHEMLSEALSKTTDPGNPPTAEAVQRVTYWLSTATVNNATYFGNGARGGSGMRWVTMMDASVRAMHRAANGQIASSDGTFDIGGNDLRYPGEPVGPPEVWINCRCILAPARVEGALTMVAAITAEDVEIDESDDEMPMDEPEEGEEIITEVPVHGVAVIEGKKTGDGRFFNAGGVTWGDLPQPLGFEFETSHGGDNSRVSNVGRIDEFYRHEGEDGVNEIRWRGVIMPAKPYASQALEGLIDGSFGGLSIIADDVVADVEATEASFEATPDGARPTTHYSESRIRRFDLVMTPAFQEAYAAMGHEFEDEQDVEALAAALLAGCDCVETIEEAREAIIAAAGPRDPEEDDGTIALGYDAMTASTESFVPGTKDGPGWITHPIPTARIRRYWTKGPGAAKIRWGLGAPGGDFNRCRRQLAKYVQNPQWLAGLCANMHKEVTGFWPGSRVNRAGRTSIQEGVAMSLVAAGPSIKPAAAFKNPNLEGPTPITITEDGHIFGHLAAWGVCHIGIQDVCTVAPRSQTNYAGFRTGTVVTEEGRVPVGHITMGTGHASIKAKAKEAVAHYDNTGYVVADVAAGEDAHGIWVAGLLRPSATQEQIDALQASALSGDWRQQAFGLELVAALAVNVPGFPIPRTSLAASAADGQTSLVAAGVVARDTSLTAGLLPSSEEIAGIVRTTIEEFRHQEMLAARRAAVEPFMQKARESGLEKIKNYFQGE